jgi:hypothetical protein
MANKKIDYIFEFEGGEHLVYELEFHEKTNHYIPKSQGPSPDWTALDHHQCENCPLSKGDTPQCPIARNLAEVVNATKTQISHQKAVVVVKTKERTYCKNTTLQDGLFSLFGVIMASSGCPHLDWLRPLVKFHLPFATVEETLFRAVSMYLLKQYLGHKNGRNFDTKIMGLLKNYEEVEKVNLAFSERIKSITKGDADKNALVALNIFAQMFSCEWNNNFDLLSKLFFDDLKKTG